MAKEDNNEDKGGKVPKEIQILGNKEIPVEISMHSIVGI